MPPNSAAASRVLSAAEDGFTFRFIHVVFPSLGFYEYSFLPTAGRYARPQALLLLLKECIEEGDCQSSVLRLWSGALFESSSSRRYFHPPEPLLVSGETRRESGDFAVLCVPSAEQEAEDQAAEANQGGGLRDDA
jgi:hypothetical protein